MKSPISYNVCIAMENPCQIRIFGAMNAIELKTKRIGHPGRSIRIHNIGWEKTRQAINDAVMTRTFRVRMRLAHQLFIAAIGTTTNGEGSA